MPQLSESISDLACGDPILGKKQLKEGRVEFCSEFEWLFTGIVSIMMKRHVIPTLLVGSTFQHK